MVFKGRTVFVFIIIAMLAGGFLYHTVDTWSALLVNQDPSTQDNNAVKASPANSPSVWEQSGLTEDELTKIASTYFLIDQKFYQQVDKQKVIDGAINGMLSALDDPYTVYMDQEQAKQFTETVIDSSFSGIGAEVTMEDGKVTVIAPIKDSPAEKAGIHARDQILSVNGVKLDGLSLNESVMKIRGPKGTQAKLEVLRPGSSESVEIIVVRDDIDLETVYSEMLENDIGKIEIRRFAQNTAERFIEDIQDLESKGMKALIIDVRNNPGGILHIVIEMLEPLIPGGKIIVQTEDREEKRQATMAKSGDGKNYPIAVLTNQGSASASEILAAAIQESAGGMVIGETTFGKGSVQSTFETGVRDGSNIKLTISKWLTPKGNFINGLGVKPNIEVKLPEYYRTMPLPKDTLLQYDMLSNDVISLQIILKGLGYTLDRTDGYFSLQTKAALEAFQGKHELEITGELDGKTATKLEEEIIKVMRLPENDKQLVKAIEQVTKSIKK